VRAATIDPMLVYNRHCIEKIRILGEGYFESGNFVIIVHWAKYIWSAESPRGRWVSGISKSSCPMVPVVAFARRVPARAWLRGGEGK
jgi:hypothetical protein